MGFLKLLFGLVQVLIRLLSTCASSSALSTKELLEMGISGILRDILASSGLVSQIAVPFSSNRPPDQVTFFV